MRILLQIVVMVALIGGLLWYVGVGSLVATLSQMKLEYFAHRPMGLLGNKESLD